MSDQDKAAAARGARRAQLAQRIALIEDTRAEIERLLDAAGAQIASILAAQPSEAEQWLLPQLQASIRQALGEFGDQAAATLATASGDAWRAGQALIDAPLAAGGAALAVAVPIIDTRQLLAMRAFMTDRIKDVGVQAINRINTQLGLVVLGAQPPTAAVSGVKRILGDTSRVRAITITRTELSRVYSTAAHERLLQQAKEVPGLKKQWRKSGKLHPRHTHQVADGQVQDVNLPFKVGGVAMMYPHDPKAPAAETINCGCTLLPWMASWGDAMKTPGRSPER